MTHTATISTLNFKPAEAMTDQELMNFIDDCEAAYRAGRPLLSDAEFDHHYLAELKRRDPENERFSQIGEEAPEVFGTALVSHKSPMLSTNKVYTAAALSSFLDAVGKAAATQGLSEDEVYLDAMAKLDGIAGNDDKDTGILATRGNGLRGSDISHAFQRGFVAVGGRGQGRGELVLEQSYFVANMAEHYDHPRNVVTGLVKADSVSEHGQRCLAAGAARFVPYSTLPRYRATLAEYRKRPHETFFRLLSEWRLPYLTDGIVVEVVDSAVRGVMGSTSHHHRWQCALKLRGERRITTVREITWQTGRTGVVTPVYEVEPIRVSGATINRVSGHNAGLFEANGAGPGARVAIVRAGEVIPDLDEVLESAPVTLPTNCPSCGYELEREESAARKDGYHLVCRNMSICPAQVARRIEHFFHTLGTADNFGPSAVAKLTSAGVTSLSAIYEIDAPGFEALGFGPGQSARLVSELERSRHESVEDWRWLGSFGLKYLGRGMCRRLLAHYPLEELANLSVEQVMAIEGFGETSSPVVVAGLQAAWPEISALLAMGFNLMRTPLVSEQAAVESPIQGKGIVFTGAMERASRKDMESHARSLGAVVQSSVTSKTDILVCGKRVGATKIEAARRNNTQVLTEDEYFALVS